MHRRSVLFSPGDQAEKLRKAPTTGADVVVFDLEDGIHPNRKDEARTTVRRVLEDLDADCEVCLRVNPIDEGAADDVATVLEESRPDSLMVPKTDGADDVQELQSMLEERDLSLPVLALLETAAGVLNAEEVAAADPVDALVFGAQDLAGDVGATPTPDGTELSHARQHVLLAARAAGVGAIDTHYPAYQDPDGLRTDARRALALGYDGKLAIHPDQVSIINEAFTPEDDRIEWARRVLAARDDAARDDEGVFVVDGEMIDAPQVRQAKRVLDRAGEDAGF